MGSRAVGLKSTALYTAMKTAFVFPSCFELPQIGYAAFFRSFFYYRSWFKLWDVSCFLAFNNGTKGLPDQFPAITLLDFSLGIPSKIPSGFYAVSCGERIPRQSVWGYPGSWRTLRTIIEFARRSDVERIIYIEWDFFVLSLAMVSEIADTREGYYSYWCSRFSFPETACQIICKDSFDRIGSYLDVVSPDYCNSPDKVMEAVLPFTPRKHFVGDRYSEIEPFTVPEDADYAAQLGFDYSVSFDFADKRAKVERFPCVLS